MRRYLIQMAVRVALFLAAAAAYAWHAPMWVVFATLLGAAVLPYTAVVGANAGRERPTGTASYVTREPLAIGYGVVIDGAEDPTGRDGDHNAPADAADRAAPADAEDRAAPADGADNGRHHD